VNVCKIVRYLMCVALPVPEIEFLGGGCEPPILGRRGHGDRERHHSKKRW